MARDYRKLCLAAAVSAGVVTAGYYGYVYYMAEHPLPTGWEADKGSVAQGEEEGEEAKDGIEGHLMPWETRVCVLTFGCSHNSSDGEYMKGVLKEDGFVLIDTPEDAHVVVINSCTVKNPSQDSAMNLVKKCAAKGQKVVVGGCVPQAEHSLPWLKDVSLVGVEQIAQLPMIVQNAMNGQRTVLLKANKTLIDLELPKVRRNEFVEIIAINQGCLGRCTYCKTRFARGTLSSYPKEQLIERVKHAVLTGAQQIWLTSEDTGAFGLDFNNPYLLKDLLRDMCDTLDEMPETKYSDGTTKVKIRVGMTNPPYILNQLDELATLFSTRQQLFRFLHIPVQSGSNKVLGDMIRDYTVEEFNQCIEALRAKVNDPPIKFSTDIICAFPYEEDSHHQESLDLLKDKQIDAVNISQYYARPGTAAAKMPQVPKSIAKARTKDVTNVFNDYRTFDYLIGQEVLVWFSEMSDRSPHVVGHTDAYVKALVSAAGPGTKREMKKAGLPTWDLPKENQPEPEEKEGPALDDQLAAHAADDLMEEPAPVEQHPLLSRCARVKIAKATKWHVEGEIIEILE